MSFSADLQRAEWLEIVIDQSYQRGPTVAHDNDLGLKMCDRVLARGGESREMTCAGDCRNGYACP